MNLKELPTVLISGLTEEEEREAILLDNAHYGEWDWDLLANGFNEFDLGQFGIEIPTFELDGDEEEEETKTVEQPKVCPHCGGVIE